MGTVEAYVLNGINEILPSVFFYFSSDFRKKNRYGGIVFSGGYKLNFPPIVYIFHPVLEKKNRYSGSVFTEGCK